MLTEQEPENGYKQHDAGTHIMRVYGSDDDRTETLIRLSSAHVLTSRVHPQRLRSYQSGQTSNQRSHSGHGLPDLRPESG
eukprot:801996-Rhodomonas_salina.1